MLGGCLAERILTPGSRTFLGVQNSSEGRRAARHAALFSCQVGCLGATKPLYTCCSHLRITPVQNSDSKRGERKALAAPFCVLSVGGGKAAPRWTAQPRVFREIIWDNLASQIDILLTKQTTHVLHATSPPPRSFCTPAHACARSHTGIQILKVLFAYTGLKEVIPACV